MPTTRDGQTIDQIAWEQYPHLRDGEKAGEDAIRALLWANPQLFSGSLFFPGDIDFAIPVVERLVYASEAVDEDVDEDVDIIPSMPTPTPTPTLSAARDQGAL